MSFHPEEAHHAPQTKVRLAYLVTHPIQYQAPLLRRIAQEPDIDLTVLFGSDFSIRGYQDQGFGVDVKWDIPLLEGYRHEFLPKLRDIADQTFASPLNYGILTRLAGHGANAPYDALWVHGYATVNALHGIIAAKALGIPVLLRADMWLNDRPRSGLTLQAKKLFFHLLKKNVDGILAVGTLNAEYWRHYLGDSVPIFLMPYAVDNAYFQQKTAEASVSRNDFLKTLDLAPGRPIILFASKLQERKRCADLIAAYKKLLDRSPLIAPYLVIVGDGAEGSSIEEMVRSAQLNDVRFCGFRNQSELPRFYDIATMFVLPARHEPWGLVVNEVMNAGKPVILSDSIGAQPDLITDGIEGCIFHVEDVDGLTDALEKVLANPFTAAEMGRRALAKINTWSFEEDIHALRTALAHVTGKFTA